MISVIELRVIPIRQKYNLQIMVKSRNVAMSLKIVLLAAIFLFFANPVLAINENVLEPQSTVCIGLKSFKNMEELVYQIYTNLDTDCLFKMEPRELADIWQIPIIIVYKNGDFSRERRPASLGAHDHLHFAVYETDGDPYIDYFRIVPANGVSVDSDPFFPGKDYLGLLPKPLICGHTFKNLVWPNSNKTRMMFLTGGGEIGNVQMITVADFVFLDKFENCYYDTKK